MTSTAAATTTSGDTNVMRNIRVACIGGGQLGRMMALEAPRVAGQGGSIEMSFLDPAGLDCPAAQVVPSKRIIKGSLTDADKIRELAKNCDVLTVEIEHVGVETLEELETKYHVNVQPSSRVLRIIRDKLIQKEHFAAHGIAVPPFRKTSTVQEIQEAGEQLGLPLMLKSRKGGYDGKGNVVLRDTLESSIQEALASLGCRPEEGDTSTSTELDLYAEGWVDFDCEIAVMVVRSSATGGEAASYPAVNAIQENSICRVVLAPARNISPTIQAQCKDMAIAAIDSLGGGAKGGGASGMFGVELFVTKSNQVLLNEIAPRPHNTGHYTQDACSVNQFENHLRGITGMPLGSTAMMVESAAMVNILGASNGSTDDTLKSSNAALSMPRAVVHWYGKSTRPGRKMGHINITGDSHAEVDEMLRPLMEMEGIAESLLAGGSSSSSSSAPLVGIIMGSQSDLPTMQAAVEILRKFHVPLEVDIVSAHRTPDKLCRYARQAEQRGIRVIIAGAGGAAHLPGMVASMTCIPVIGVPVKTSTLSGVDSLYSIVQMPRGIPVATVAIGNAQNAGLLAVRILSTSRPSLRRQMMTYQDDLTDMVNGMSSKLLELGPDEFLQQQGLTNKSVNV